MRTRNSQHAARARAFTLIEVLLVVVIMTVLAALLFVAIGAAVRAVRRAGEQQYVRSLATAVEQYRQNVGGVPPLVADGPDAATGPLVLAPPAGTPDRPRFKGETPTDLSRAVRYLRYEVDADVPNTDRLRSSKYTLSIYVLGVLGKTYDGVDGPGFTKPDTDGVFARAGSVTQPLFDISKNAERVRRDPLVPAVIGAEDPAARTIIVDRWNNPILYYRWLPTYHTASAAGVTSVYPGAPANTTAQAKEVRSYNVPPGVGNPLTNPELRGATCAIVSAGPDGLINDANADAPENQDNIVEVVK